MSVFNLLSIQVNFKFTVPQTVQRNQLDEWLNGVLQAPPVSANTPATHPQTEPSGVLAGLMGAIQRLTTGVLQWAYFPVFDLPALATVQAGESGVVTASLQFPYRGAWPSAVYEQATSLAVKYVLWMNQNPVNDANKAALFADIERSVLNAFRAQSGSGKSTLPVLRAAHAMGIPYRCLGAGVYQLGLGSQARRLDRSVCDGDSAIGAKLSQNKAVTANLLRMAGLPAPNHRVVGKAQDLPAVAQQLGFPLVVKPSDLDRGEGVVVDIFDEAALGSAFEQAVKLSPSKQAIVEQQVQGTCHRLFMFNGALLYAVKRRPMGVFGDGVNTVAQLVGLALAEQAQLPPWARSELKPLDEAAHAELVRQNLTAESIPVQAQFVSLRRIESTRDGGVDEDVSAQIHPDNLDIARHAARLFGLVVAGIDIITEDISKPWHHTGAIINEVNFAPLLGGGDISRANLSRFLTALLPNKGLIPIERFAQDNFAGAQARHLELLGTGARSVLLSSDCCIAADGANRVLTQRDLASRLWAVTMDATVDAVVVVG